MAESLKAPHRARREKSERRSTEGRRGKKDSRKWEALRPSSEEKKKQRAEQRKANKFWKEFNKNPPDIIYHKGKNLLIPKTEYTPGIYFEYDTGSFSIIGLSMFDEPVDFYWPLLTWVESYLKHNQNKKIVLTLDLGALGIHDSLMIADLASKIPSTSCVQWLFEDEDQEEEGVDFAEFYNVLVYLVNKSTGGQYKVGE